MALVVGKVGLVAAELLKVYLTYRSDGSMTEADIKRMLDDELNSMKLKLGGQTEEVARLAELIEKKHAKELHQAQQEVEKQKIEVEVLRRQVEQLMKDKKTNDNTDTIANLIKLLTEDLEKEQSSEPRPQHHNQCGRGRGNRGGRGTRGGRGGTRPKATIMVTPVLEMVNIIIRITEEIHAEVKEPNTENTKSQGQSQGQSQSQGRDKQKAQRGRNHHQQQQHQQWQLPQQYQRRPPPFESLAPFEPPLRYQPDQGHQQPRAGNVYRYQQRFQIRAGNVYHYQQRFQIRGVPTASGNQQYNYSSEDNRCVM